MPLRPDICIILATYNRAEELRRTLEGMERLDISGINFQLVLVDNGSTDATQECIRSFATKLPIQSLLETRPGKSFALNRALGEATLGEIVVFTDDDVDPQPDWLQHIADACRRWPDRDVFGGRIDVVWPVPNPPNWALDPVMQSWAFSRHNLGETERAYPASAQPFGGNFWVRRSVLENGRRFSEILGPPPHGCAMGEDTLFLRTLRNEGHEIVYCPKAAVGHRIQPNLLTYEGIRERAWRFGSQGPHVEGLCRTDLLAQSPMLWRLLRIGSIFKGIALVGWSLVSFSTDRRIERSTMGLQIIAYNMESLRLSGQLGDRRSGSNNTTHDTGNEVDSAVKPRRAGDAL